MMNKDAYTLWEQEGDLERMKLFFREVNPDSGQKDRIKKLALEKIREEDLKAANGESSGAVVIPEVPLKESLHEKTQRRLKSFWWRWQWKLAVPAVVVLMIAFVGIGMEGLKNSPLEMNQFSALSEAREQSSAQNSTANDSVGVAEAPPELGNRTMVGSSDFTEGVAKEGISTMPSTANSGAIYGETAPIMPIPEPQIPPADAGLAKKITYNVHATLQVEDVSLSLATVTQEILGLGGYVVESSQSNQPKESSGYATFNIPSPELEGFQGRLANLGKVLNQSTTAYDVTNQYYDTQSRLKNLIAQEARYLEILDEAKNVEDILHIESYLSSTRMQIEQLQGQVKLWDHQVAYSTVTIYFQTTPNPVSVDEPWQPISWENTWQAAKDAVLKTISSTWNGINYLFVGIAYALPYLLLVGGIYGVYRLIRISRQPKK
ncbi:hypothetical protein Desdi_1954 [Desulfitobacterium dichloroeliminans LMG P-21439]|uniref:DUF4349 domain-containing protein n=1 Tax=Desulfitobacterium dichloroeliminans (strain LMG P-21439 / DCA1) TaxID=871963 RepID=L0F879_DESDL|nr:DUF4349 domain-containing protein [Desulfitobacterium dichloroeliminans]AGA69402.1 hypothetical protein Desdi_1954 [Desulfitobacterium dichloroeliminans LMG P-21439]